jgi:6-phosphogluconolactonase (cycloisomerase 2 family)
MRRTFVSITALAAAVILDIGQFLTSQTRTHDRIAVLRATTATTATTTTATTATTTTTA